MPLRRLPPLLAALLVLSACSAKERVVDVAVAVPLTGDMGTEGRGVRNAVELAVSVANLIAADPRVAGVIGHYTSGCALAAAPIYAKSSIPMLTPSATNPD